MKISLKRPYYFIVNIIRHIRHQVQFRYFRRSLIQKTGTESEEYTDYLEAQLHRTLLKIDAPLQPRTRLMVGKVAEFTDLTKCRVLCIGCRNNTEVDYFASKGARRVVGIDLYSKDERILVMDMHAMTFPDDSFDVVYTSHSLEHAQDVAQVAAEIVRVGRAGAVVAVEVPAQYDVRGADLVDFGTLPALHAVFSPHIGQFLWSDEQPAHSPTNEGGTAVIRTLFTLSK